MNPIRILIADKLAPEGARWLNDQPNVTVTNQTGLEGDALADALAAHDGVVIRSAVKIRRDTLDATMARSGASLKGIARAGVGVDNIDLDAATEYGIAVMNSASASTITTAEHAFALMMALARNIGPGHMTMSGGGWDRSKYVGKQLHGRTVGVVGMGRIGQTFAARALAFGMKVIGFDPYVSAETMMDGQVPMVKSFDDLIPQIDVVSFHVPKTEQTAGMLGAAQFAQARPGLLVVNAARGGIVDEAALIAALDAGQCAGAALDVYPTEPPPDDDPLRAHPKILTTPHLGASTEEAQEAVAVDACKALLMYLRGEGLMGAVNAGGLNLDLNDRQKHFADLASRMVRLLDAAAGTPAFNALHLRTRGPALAHKADTIARIALVDALRNRVEQSVSMINAQNLADERGISVSSSADAADGEDRLRVELKSDGEMYRVDGAIFEDGALRITNLNGYAMDMTPTGHLALLTNDDVPGMIGSVGRCVGEAGVNIAEMVIGRKPEGDNQHTVAMMILKVDAPLGDDVVVALRNTSGIRAVSTLTM